MIKIYTVSSCTSCKKAKTWLNAHQLSYKEQNLGKEGITKEEILDILLLNSFIANFKTYSYLKASIGFNNDAL